MVSKSRDTERQTDLITVLEELNAAVFKPHRDREFRLPRNFNIGETRQQ